MQVKITEVLRHTHQDGYNLKRHAIINVTENRSVLARGGGGGWEKRGKMGDKVQASSYKINQSVLGM